MARDVVTAKQLRAGNLAEQLLKPGRGVVLRAGGRHLTRDELRDEAGRVAGGLRKLGVKPGERAAIYAANSLDWITGYLGVLRAGACAVMMNPDYHSAEAEHILRDSEPRLVLADQPRAEVAAKLGLQGLPVGEQPRAPPPPPPGPGAERP